MSPRLAKIEFRNLRKHEIPKILQLCAKEGRHMGTAYELETWFQIDKDGFFVAVTEEGEIVGSCVAIRLSAHHGNVGMFVVKEQFRGCGIGTTIWDKAISHLGEQRNKGLSAIPKLFHIYVDRAHFNKVAPWDVVLYKLDGKRLLSLAVDFLKSGPTKHDSTAGTERSFESRLADQNDKLDDRSDDSNSESSSGSKSEDLNSIIENEELNSDSFNHHHYRHHHTVLSTSSHLNSNSNRLRNSLSSPTGDTLLSDGGGQQTTVGNCLKDITHEKNLARKDLNSADSVAREQSVWIRKKKSDLSLSKDKIHTFNQLIYYSSPKPHLSSLSTYSAHKVFPRSDSCKPSSPSSLSLPSLLNSDSYSIFDRNAFNHHHKSSLGNNHLQHKSSLFLRPAGDRNSVRIVPYSRCWLHKLIDYDQELNGYNRSKIVTLSVDEEDSKTKLAIVGEEVVGYAIVKYSLQDIYLIAPLYADSQSIANDLIKEFVRSMSIDQLKKGLVLKMPSTNHSAIELIESLGFEKQDYLVTRCFTGYVHQTQTSRIFAMQSTVFSSE